MEPSLIPELEGEISNVERYPFATGGLGDIYLGTWVRSADSSVKVAIKVFRGAHLQHANKKEFKRRLHREYRIWASLDHPNILPLYGLYSNESVVASSSLVSPFRADRDVHNFIQKYPNANKMELIQGIVSGLHYLHSKDIIHGDMKPQNIMVHRNGNNIVPELGDFGGSRGIVRNVGDTTVLKTTTRYVAPEILDIKNDKNLNTVLSKAADVYSFGMVMLYVLSGEIPFHDINEYAISENVRLGNRPQREMYSEELISDFWWNLMTRCWATVPSERPLASTSISNM